MQPPDSIGGVIIIISQTALVRLAAAAAAAAVSGLKSGNRTATEQPREQRVEATKAQAQASGSRALASSRSLARSMATEAGASYNCERESGARPAWLRSLAQESQRSCEHFQGSQPEPLLASGFTLVRSLARSAEQALLYLGRPDSRLAALCVSAWRRRRR